MRHGVQGAVSGGRNPQTRPKSYARDVRFLVFVRCKRRRRSAGRQSRDIDSPARSGAYAASLWDMNSVKSCTRLVLRVSPCVSSQSAPYMCRSAPGALTSRGSSGATVSHVEDFENGVLLSNVAMPDGRLFRLTGTIKEEGGERPPLSNKQIVTKAMHELFEKGDVLALDRYWREPYTQHSPHMASGLGTLRSVAPTLKGFS
jgi:hypothetical protein